MKMTRLMAWLALCAAPLGCAAQIVSGGGVDVLKNTYFGINVGRSDYSFRNSPTGSADFCDGAFDCEKHPGGWKATAGYMFLPYVGLEGVAYSAGDAWIKIDEGGGLFLRQKVRIDGIGLSGVGALPLGPVVLNARAGYALSTVYRRDDENGVFQGRSDKTRGEPIFGAGIGVTVWRGLFVRLDWDRVRGRTTFGEEFQADLYSTGVGWRF